MTFTTRKLAGGRVVVGGSDNYGNSGQTTVDGREWAELQRTLKHKTAHEKFDQTVEEFFAPLTEAIEALNSDAKPVIDPVFNVVLVEGEEGQSGVQEVVAHLSKDSAILRLLEESSANPRLIWISATELEILEAPAAVVPDVVADDEATA